MFLQTNLAQLIYSLSIVDFSVSMAKSWVPYVCHFSGGVSCHQAYWSVRVVVRSAERAEGPHCSPGIGSAGRFSSTRGVERDAKTTFLAGSQRNSTPARTRTWNLRLRRATPCPLGHRGSSARERPRTPDFLTSGILLLPVTRWNSKNIAMWRPVTRG